MARFFSIINFYHLCLLSDYQLWFVLWFWNLFCVATQDQSTWQVRWDINVKNLKVFQVRLIQLADNPTVNSLLWSRPCRSGSLFQCLQYGCRLSAKTAHCCPAQPSSARLSSSALSSQSPCERQPQIANLFLAAREALPSYKAIISAHVKPKWFASRKPFPK